MPNSLIPNTIRAKGKTRFRNVQSLSSISLNTSTQAQGEVDIPVQGDVVGFGIKLTVTGAGSVVVANTIEKVIHEIAIKDKRGKPIWSNIAGSHLPMLARFLNRGQSRTVPTVTTAAQSHNFYIPFNIEQKDMVAKLRVTLAAYSALGTGVTGATVSLDFNVWYADSSELNVTQRLSKITAPLVAGTNVLNSILPKQVLISNLFATVTDESYYTSLTFSEDGRLEFDTMTLNDLKMQDDEQLIDGHVTGQFSLYNSPFVSSDKTVLNFINSTADSSFTLFILELDFERN